MAAKSNFLDTAILQLLFNGTGIANLADNAASSPLTNLYMSLHTATPGASGNQSTNEAAYTSYARVAIARSTSGWTVTSGSVSPNYTINFPQATGGSETETFIGIGTAATGAGTLLYYAQLTPSISVAVNTVPQILPASTIQET